MKYFSALMMFVSMLIIGGGCCTSIKTTVPNAVDESQQNVIKLVEDSTVALVKGTKDEKDAYCAGVWIEDKTIITAAHCVETFSRMLFDVPPLKDYNPVGDLILFVNHGDLLEGRISSENVWVGVVDKFDKKRDLATLQVIGETSPHSIVKIIQEPVPTGQALHIMGHTVGMIWSYSHGYVASTRKIEGPADVEIKAIQVSAPVWLGNSGGGAFNSEGRLVGICSWVNTRAPNIAFFVHIDEILGFLGRK